jgi:hypothetical protein
MACRCASASLPVKRSSDQTREPVSRDIMLVPESYQYLMRPKFCGPYMRPRVFEQGIAGKRPDAVARSEREAMNKTASPIIDGPVDEEIRRLVAEAVASRNTIATSECVKKIRTAFPTCGLSKRQITDRVIATAAAAGAAVEFGETTELPD